MEEGHGPVASTGESMFVCDPCHKRMACYVEHSAVSFGPCEGCGKEAETRDCVASRPVTNEELAAVERFRRMHKESYRDMRRVEYPRQKE